MRKDATADPLLIESAIAADYLREHTSFEEAARILYEAAFVTLLPFCDPHQFRYDIGEPFAKGGWLYATDARVAIRVPTRLPDSGGKRPGVEPMFATYFREIDKRQSELFADDLPHWQPWPTRPIEVPTEPEKQTGITCPICDGAGHYYTDGDARKCVYCDGDGMVERLDNVLLGATAPVVAGRYWSLISRLPNVWYREPQRGTEPVAFRFEHGQGLLMTIKSEDET